MDCSPPGSSVHGILQARILEWVATLFSRGPSQPRDQNRVSRGSCTAGTFFIAEPVGKLSNYSNDFLLETQGVPQFRMLSFFSIQPIPTHISRLSPKSMTPHLMTATQGSIFSCPVCYSLTFFFFYTYRMNGIIFYISL